jgi:SAM-dependent methyltransferase
MAQKPYLNLGCGRIILPAPKPTHHALVDDAVYAYPLWTNADRNAEPGVDCVMDAFRYPWDFADNSFDGALLTHLIEHVPHEIKLKDDSERAQQLAKCQDGFYSFFAELYRVLTPGAVVHILSPYGWSQGAITDPTHTRLITEHTFSHSMQPDPNSPFKYETGGIHFEMVDAPRYTINELFSHLVGNPQALQYAFQTQLNVAYEIMVKLRVIK